MNQPAINPNGQVFRSSEIEKISQVTPILVTPKRITLDWSQNGEIGHLDAKSKDGVHFHGQYGCVPNDADFKCELTLYQGQGEQLLFGTWWENGTARQGILAFRLPAKVAPSSEWPTTASTSPAVPAQAEQPARMQPARPQPAKSPQPASQRPATSDHQPASQRLPPWEQPAAVKPPSAAREPMRPTAQPPLPRGPAAPAATPASVATPAPASAQIDHLLAMTAEQFEREDHASLEKELAGAPLSAVFKVAHNALSPELRTLADSVFTNRYGGLADALPPAPVQRPSEPPEFKAIKRRSSRHSKNR
jgi:hypothetical protein